MSHLLLDASKRLRRSPPFVRVRQIRPVETAGTKVPIVAQLRPLTDRQGRPTSKGSSAARRPGQQKNVAIATVDRECWQRGPEPIVPAPDGPRNVLVKDKI